VSETLSTLIDPSTLRWIGFSHFEADECGALNEWLAVAPAATPVCSFVGKVVSVDDFTQSRPAYGMSDGETFETGSKRFRFVSTPHVPHCWEAGMLFEETTETLFCSDLFHQNGDVEALTGSSLIDRARETFLEFEKSPLANYFPYTAKTDEQLKKLADLKPRRIATMHGSVFEGVGATEFTGYRQMVGEVLVQR